jgi:metallo-beta-lactamase class B
MAIQSKERRKPGDAYNPLAFKDQKGYDEAVKKLQEEFERMVEKER